MEDPQYMDGLYIIYNRKTYEKVGDLGYPPFSETPMKNMTTNLDLTREVMRIYRDKFRI